MKLDSRIIEGKRPLSCIDTDEAKQFIGKEGYFAGSLLVYKNIDYFDKWTLTEIKDDASQCFKDSRLGEWWDFFLPAEWVKNEPEWRPYLIDEWLQEHNFGDMIEFRHKSIKRELTVMFTGQVREIDGTMRIILGANAYDFDELFEYYELMDKTNDGKFVWRPFGIEVKE